ncbi:hypothetical protein D5278_09720 [bacterium 1XD21-13]|nr:hypothetical protein [bacterium 1XD21-13]
MPPSTDSLRICQTGEKIFSYPPLRGAILAIFENAKNERKKQEIFFDSLFQCAVSCGSDYSVFM